MATASFAEWTWLRYPDARIEGGYVVRGQDTEEYQPGEKYWGLLNDILRVDDEKTALRFAQRWGLLGLEPGPQGMDTHAVRVDDALWFAEQIQQQGKPRPIPQDIHKRVVECPKREPIRLITEFARTMDYLTEARFLRDHFAEDPRAAGDETLRLADRPFTHEPLGLVVWMLNESRKDLEKHFTTGYAFSEFFLDVLIYAARSWFFDKRQRGVWVELDPRNGGTVYKFDGLFRFIAYCALSDGTATPKKCEDCGLPFFPTRSSGRFCPPPPGGKRSRCEDRHRKRNSRAKSG